jgi:hypothetical protein
MSYRSAVVEDRVMFFLSDTEIIELNSYDKMQKLVNASEGNLDQLLAEIRTNLLAFADEELDLMESVDDPLLTKTLAYAKIMQVVSHYFFQEERKRLDAEKEKEVNESNGDWSWTG